MDEYPVMAHPLVLLQNYQWQLDSLVNAMLSWTQTQRVVLWKAILPLG